MNKEGVAPLFGVALSGEKRGEVAGELCGEAAAEVVNFMGDAKSTTADTGGGGCCEPDEFDALAAALALGP